MSAFLGIKDLESRIVGPGIPSVGQEAFDAGLRRRCGCRLAWHARRRVFLVWRPSGSRATFYPTELGRAHFPLGDAILGVVVDAVRLSDGLSERDLSKSMDVFIRRQEDMKREAFASYVDDRMPCFRDDLGRMLRILREGSRARTRTVVDLAPSKA